MDLSISDIEHEFLDFLESRGLFVAGGLHLKIDGRKHRVTMSGDKPKSDNGEYKVFADEYYRGWMHNWKTGQFEMWNVHGKSDYTGLSAEEKQALAEKWDTEVQARKDKEARSRAQGSHLARIKWESGTPASPVHGYALKKGLKSVYNARLLGDSLIWPMYDTSGEIVNIQTITTQGVKRPQTGAPKAGNFGFIPAPDAPCTRAEIKGSEGFSENDKCETENILQQKVTSRAWIVEGWATGCTVAEATGECVVIAVDCGNLMSVVKNVRRMWPEVEFVLAADNDHHTNGNPGLNAAVKAFEDTGVPFCAPDFESEDDGTDWNDFTAKHGIKRCKALLLHKLAEFKKKSLYIAKHLEPQFVDLTESGRPLGTIENLRALIAFAGMSVSYNEIKKEEVFSMPGRFFCGDNAKNAAMGEILSLCSRWRMPKTDIDPLISNIGSQNISNPVKDWIMSEPWDGLNRVQNVCDSIVEEDNYPHSFKETLIRRWLISGVAAAFMERGFRCRGVLTFIGGQGIGKTTWFRTLVGNDDFFSEGLGLNLKDKDSIKAGISAWGVEFGELESTFNRSDLPILKAFITRSSDKIRMPWSRKESDFQRRTFYGATVNQRQILLDDTGNGRWWCIPVERIAMIDRAEMQQMWREVYERFYLMHLKDPKNPDYQWWLTKEEDEILELQNRDFLVPSSVEEMIVTGLEWEAVKATWSYRTTSQILQDCGYPPTLPKPSELVKAAKVLHKLTGDKSKPMGHSNARMWLAPPKRTIFIS